MAESSGNHADLEAELNALKAQVFAMRAAQSQAAAGDDSARSSAEDAPEDEPLDVAAHFEELFEQLKTEIEDIPTMTGLAIFGLGVLTGRLLAN